jgi:hypothetical protein
MVNSPMPVNTPRKRFQNSFDVLNRVHISWIKTCDHGSNLACSCFVSDLYVMAIYASVKEYNKEDRHWPGSM